LKTISIWDQLYRQTLTGSNVTINLLESIKEMSTLKPLRDLEPSQQNEDHYEYKEKFFRALADLENFKKRTIKEERDILTYKNYDILRDLVPILDNFDRALQAEELKDIQAVSDGISMIRDSLDNILETHGLERIDTIGFLFDPYVHEAVGQQPSEDNEPGVVIEEVSRGYLYKDRLLKAAQVIVSI